MKPMGPTPPKKTRPSSPPVRTGLVHALKYLALKLQQPKNALITISGLAVIIILLILMFQQDKNRDDELFEEWVRTQLQGIESWQASASLNDARNPDLTRCLWQRASEEADCLVPRTFSYPLSFRLSNGYLLSDGFRFPTNPKVSWDRVTKTLRNVSSGFGFDENWRPCLGEHCRFEVYAGFFPECAGGNAFCGRAETLRVGYIIKSRRLDRRIWQPYEQLVSNLDTKRKLQLLEFKTQNVLGLPFRGCKSSLLAPLSKKSTGEIVCGIGKKNLASVCTGKEKDYELLFRSGFCMPENCARFCQRAIKSLDTPCAAGKLEPVPRSPDLFKCNGRQKLYFLTSQKNLFENPTLIQRQSLLERVFKISFDLCLTRTVCFGSFGRQSPPREFESFLEAK